MAKSPRGFTLVKLLIVVVIIAVLSAIAIPRFLNAGTRSKEASLQSTLRLIRDAADRFEQDTGVTPKIVDALVATSAPSSGWQRKAMNSGWTSKPIIASNWKGPYLMALPINPMTGTAETVPSQTTEGAAYTHYSIQSFTPHYLYYPSGVLGSNGIPYNRW